MTQRTKMLNELLARLRSSVGASVNLQVLPGRAGALIIQVGDEPEAVLGVEVTDEQRPSFCISYPKLATKRNGDQHTSTVQTDGVLSEGVIWVVGQLAQHGVVKPEFSD